MVGGAPVCIYTRHGGCHLLYSGQHSINNLHTCMYMYVHNALSIIVDRSRELGFLKVALCTFRLCWYLMSRELTTPTPTPVGRLARAEQRKEEVGATKDRESSSSPWRWSWREGAGKEGEGEAEEGGRDGGGEGVD